MYGTHPNLYVVKTAARCAKLRQKAYDDTDADLPPTGIFCQIRQAIKWAAAALSLNAELFSLRSTRPGGPSKLASNGAEIDAIRRSGGLLSDCAHRYIQFGGGSLRYLSGDTQRPQCIIQQMKMSAPAQPRVGFNHTEPVLESGDENRSRGPKEAKGEILLRIKRKDTENRRGGDCEPKSGTSAANSFLPTSQQRQRNEYVVSGIEDCHSVRFRPSDRASSGSAPCSISASEDIYTRDGHSQNSKRRGNSIYRKKHPAWVGLRLKQSCQ